MKLQTQLYSISNRFHSNIDMNSTGGWNEKH